eukprot:gene4692-8264_t
MKRKTNHQDKTPITNGKVQKKTVSFEKVIPFALDFFYEEEIFQKLIMVSKSWKKTCYESLETMSFSECDYKTVQTVIQKLPKLTKLTIDNLDDFKEENVDDLISSCKTLKTLHLRNCSFENLIITKTEQLETLTISLSSFKTIKVHSQTLKKIEIFDNEFSNATNIECENLKELKLHTCIFESDEILFNSICDLPIEKLSINECSGLFNLRIQLINLKELNIINCMKLKKLHLESFELQKTY